MIVTRVPLRLTLGGGGTDLPFYSGKHGGVCLGVTLDKYVYVSVTQALLSRGIMLRYWRQECVSSPADLDHELARCALTHLGVVDGLEITSHSDIPAGTGLGSSAAYLVALVGALHRFRGRSVGALTAADQAAYIEMELAGLPVGKQDHYLAAAGGFSCLEISPRGRIRLSPIGITDRASEELRKRLLLFSTGIRRNAADVLSGVASADRLDGLHAIKELGLATKAALESNDLDAVGYLFHEHWLVKKGQCPGTSSDEIDKLYAEALDAGAIGGKLVGAGGGGFLALLCRADTIGDVNERMTELGLERLTYRFEHEGLRSFRI